MPVCNEPGCAGDAAYWLYSVPRATWLPICQKHAELLHPSLEIHAWLTSGYLKPIELPKPTAPPVAPDEERAKDFRALVTDTMNW